MKTEIKKQPPLRALDGEAPDTVMGQKRTCFVITPIGGEADPIRRHINGIIDAAIIPALDKQFQIKVAHRMPDPGSINKQVIQQVYGSDLVVANLTDKNPNVMYELALRHCTGKPAIIIADEASRPLPFDITTERTIFYRNDAQGGLDLCEALKECVGKICFDEASQQGPVYDALREIGVTDAIIKEVSREAEGEDKADAMRYILERLDAIDGFIKMGAARDAVIQARGRSSRKANTVRLEIELAEEEDIQWFKDNDDPYAGILIFLSKNDIDLKLETIDTKSKILEFICHYQGSQDALIDMLFGTFEKSGFHVESVSIRKDN